MGSVGKDSWSVRVEGQVGLAGRGFGVGGMPGVAGYCGCKGIRVVSPSDPLQVL